MLHWQEYHKTWLEELLDRIGFVCDNIFSKHSDWLDFPLTNRDTGTWVVFAISRKGLRLLGKRIRFVPANNIYNVIGEMSMVVNPKGGMGIGLGSHPPPKELSPKMIELRNSEYYRGEN